MCYNDHHFYIKKIAVNLLELFAESSQTDHIAFKSNVNFVENMTILLDIKTIMVEKCRLYVIVICYLKQKTSQE